MEVGIRSEFVLLVVTTNFQYDLLCDCRRVAHSQLEFALHQMVTLCLLKRSLMSIYNHDVSKVILFFYYSSMVGIISSYAKDALSGERNEK